jgi:hypothetical protein
MAIGNHDIDRIASNANRLLHSPVLEQLEPRVLLSTTVFAEDFSGSYPGDWSIGHDSGDVSTCNWVWPDDYAELYDAVEDSF